MIKLYEIAENFKNLQELLEDETVPQEMITEALNQVEGSFDEKAENIVKYCKSLDGEVAAYKEEEKRLAAHRKSLENKIAGMKEYLLFTMLSINKKKIDTPLFKISVKKNPASVVIDNLEAIPEDYLIFKMDADKKRISEILKAGETIEGCHLEQKESLSIK